MLESSNSKFSACKLRQKIVGMLGASPTQYSHLLQTEKIVEKRALKGKLAFNLSLTVNCFFCFFVSIIVTVMVFLRIDVFTYALIGITMSMTVVALWTIPYFDILLSPTNYPVIAHTPVSSRTYFLVKLTKVITHTTLLIICSNLLPAIGGIWLRGEAVPKVKYLFPIVYLSIAFISSFFTIGVMTTFAGYLTKLYSKKSLRHIAHIAQFAFPVFFPTIWVIMHHLLPTSSPEGLIIDKLQIIMKWSYVLPTGWFAGTVSVFLGHLEWQNLILAALAVASTLFLIFIPLRSIARSYSEYLSYLLESVNKQKSELRVKTPLFAKMLSTHTKRAALCLTSAYLFRDKRIQLGLFAMLGTIAMFVFFFFQPKLYGLNPKWISHSYIFGLSPGFSIVFCYITIGFIDSFILPIRYSEHWKASWMLKVPAIAAHPDLWRGVQSTALLYIVTPCTLLMLCVATILWKFEGILYILPGVTIVLNYVLFYPRPPSGLPLSQEFVLKRVVFSTLKPFLCTILIVGIIVGIQYLTYKLGFWIYFGGYCFIVLSGLIGFIYLFFHKEISRGKL